MPALLTPLPESFSRFRCGRADEAREVRIGHGDAVAGQIDGHQIARPSNPNCPPRRSIRRTAAAKWATVSADFSPRRIAVLWLSRSSRPPDMRPRLSPGSVNSRISANGAWAISLQRRV